jgi:anti-sigma B factor antagonist
MKEGMFMNNDLIPGFDAESVQGLEIGLDRPAGHGDLMVLRLNGMIDNNNSVKFQKKILKIIENGYTNLIFNCTGLNYASSTGIASFSVLNKSVKDKGGDIALVDIQPKVLEVFQLLGFTAFFRVTPTVPDAIAFFGAKNKSPEGKAFPKIFPCVSCGKKLKVEKPGRFKCSGCGGILIVDDKGAVSPA